MVAEFLRGYKDENGVYHKDFEFREMNGTDEEAIAKPKVKENGSVVTRVLLERCIERIGTINKSDLKPNEWTKIIQSLAIGDQDIAILLIRTESLGEDIDVSHKCPYCKTKIDTSFSIEEFEYKEYIGFDEIEFELPKGFIDKEGKIHNKGVIRLPLGLDREFLGKLITQNTSKANTLLLTRCIKSLGKVPVTEDTLRVLPIKDRNYLFKKLKELTFGYEMDSFDIECPNCGEDLSISLNQVNFL